MSILTRVQANPQILTANETFVEDLIIKAKNFITEFCNLQSFPELSQGYSKSALESATDISAIDSSSFYISVNGVSTHTITIDLSACTTGELTAAELQTKIRASDTNYGYDEVNVSYDSTQYTITSGRYGLDSKINITCDDSNKHVCQNLKLSEKYGGTEVIGNKDVDALIDVCTQLVEMKYRMIGLEGIKQGAVPSGVSFTVFNIEPTILSTLLGHRKL